MAGNTTAKAAILNIFDFIFDYFKQGDLQLLKI
ncbi:MAG: hypothetical protein ACI8Q1_001815 [Parvicella sp.]